MKNVRKINSRQEEINGRQACLVRSGVLHARQCVWCKKKRKRQRNK